MTCPLRTRTDARRCRTLVAVGNLIGAVVLVLFFLDPTRDLRPIFALLAVAVLLAWVLPWFVPRR
jgi:hypothetical protein